MNFLENPREALTEAGCVVIKVGSKVLAGSKHNGWLDAFAAQIAALRAQGREVVVVTSGAIAWGYPRLGLTERPTEMALLQASAAAGQSHLMQAYEQSFAKHGLAAAQVLLTRTGIIPRDRYLNASAALNALLDHGLVPIVNENDTVSIDEITFGDNDHLAAMVSWLVGADLLILLTSVDGLLDAEQKRVSLVPEMATVSDLVKEEKSTDGTGGMDSKLKAAASAAKHGVPVVIANGNDGSILQYILDGQDVGTLVLPQGSRLASRKHWIAYTLHPEGSVVVDHGAAKALVQGKKSLLPAGVVQVQGDFAAGDSVRIIDEHGEEIARGLSRYSAEDAKKLIGVQSHEIAECLGRNDGHEIVHRDDMVVIYDASHYDKK
ncbi:MAG: glutamate 5-kinase [Myxococcales bacterium]|nr:MAG: glutamate 5-kinase [Myxococcales bacterium]